MATSYVMSETEKALFLSGDEGRGTVRLSAASSHPNTETIQIVDSNGDLFDSVSGSDDVGFAVEVDPAKIAKDKELAELRESEAFIMRMEVRNELRAEFLDALEKYADESARLHQALQKATEELQELKANQK